MTMVCEEPKRGAQEWVLARGASFFFNGNQRKGCRYVRVSVTVVEK